MMYVLERRERRWRIQHVVAAMLLLVTTGLLASPVRAQSACGDAVTVESGSTLAGIAARCGTTVAALVRANDQIEDPDVIRVGWTLRIPGTAPPDEADGRQPARRDGPRDDSGETSRYTVRAGDTLAEIAERFGTTLSVLLEDNPQIDDPAVIDVGLELVIPGTDGSGTPRRSEYAGRVSVDPGQGAPGTRVRVMASGFPPHARVNIGAGPRASEYEILRGSVRTNDNGGLVRTVSLPEHADPGRAWVFIVETDDHRVRGRSEPFDVRRDGRGAPDEGGEGEAPRRIEVTGTLTDAGVECQALRGEDGRLYTLAGDVDRFENGDRVHVEGTVAEMSFCMQGTTIAVQRIEERSRGGNGGDNLKKVVRVEGRLTDEGVECPALRSDDDRLYTLTGDLQGYEAGDRVLVEGTRAEVSICQQGTTLQIRHIQAGKHSPVSGDG